MKASLSHVFGVPITTITRKAKIPEGYFVAKSGTYVVVRGEKKFVGGYSFQKDQRRAEKIASYEVLERLFAFYGIGEKFLEPGQRCFQGKGLFDDANVIELPPERVLIGGRRDYSLDASGLAIHSSLAYAAQHAAMELIERHILAELWYKRSYSLSTVNQIREIGNGCIITSFVAQKNDGRLLPIPFALTVIENQNDELLIVGSAVSTSLQHAIEKANLEAYMLLDSSLNGDSGLTNGLTDETKDRIASLRGKASIERRNYLTSLIQNFSCGFDSRQLSIQEIWENVFDRVDGAFIVKIFSKQNLHVVRVVASYASKLREMRRIATSVITDPFC